MFQVIIEIMSYSDDLFHSDTSILKFRKFTIFVDIMKKIQDLVFNK